MPVVKKGRKEKEKKRIDQLFLRKLCCTLTESMCVCVCFSINRERENSLAIVFCRASCHGEVVGAHWRMSCSMFVQLLFLLLFNFVCVWGGGGGGFCLFFVNGWRTSYNCCTAWLTTKLLILVEIVHLQDVDAF